MDRAEGDVFPDGRAEELIVGILKDETDLGANAADRLIADLHTCNVHRSVCRSMDAVEVEHQRALPRAVGPEEGHLLAAGDVQVHAANRLGAVGVAEMQMLDVNPVVVTGRFAVVSVRMRVRRGEATAALHVRVIVGVAVVAHRHILGSTAPATVISAKSATASPLFAATCGSRSRSAPSESDPVAPRALAASSTRAARA